MSGRELGHHEFDDLPTDDSSDDLSSDSDSDGEGFYDDYDDDGEEGNTFSSSRNIKSDDDSDGDDDSDDDSNEALGARVVKRQEDGVKKRKRLADDSAASVKDVESDKKEKKKKSKHAPAEVSSKRQAFFKRGAPSLNNSGTVAINANAYKSSDPRMNSMSGTFDQDKFDSSYAFLEDVANDEIKRLKERVAASKLTGKKGKKTRKKLGVSVDDLEENEALLSKMLQEKSMRQKAQVQRAAKKAVKKKMRDRVKGGEGIYYLKRSEERKALVEAEYDELRKRGGEKAVKKAMMKKRKKQGQKDLKMLPPKPKRKF